MDKTDAVFQLLKTAGSGDAKKINKEIAEKVGCSLQHIYACKRILRQTKWRTTMPKKKQNKTDKIVQLLLEAQNPAHIGFTNKELANKLGCSVSYVWKVRKEFNEGQTEPEYHTYNDEREKANNTTEPEYHTYNDEREKANNTTDTWTRSEILTEANKYVSVDRAATHGDMEDNFREIAELWTQYTENTISPLDVSVMMTLLKIARLKSNPDNIDNWIDACGYMACGGELIAKVRK